MLKSSFLPNNSEFAGYSIFSKMSCSHDGEREVYLASDEERRAVALTLFDIRCERYSAPNAEEVADPDYIEEVCFMKKHQELKGVARYLASGVDVYDGRRYAWMAQEYVDGLSLERELSIRETLPTEDALKIGRTVASVIDKIARHTKGGGHYNISTGNIIVKYEDGVLSDVRLIGFSNMGETISGKGWIDESTLDTRFRAPETQNCIYSHSCDIYSLGMVMTLILTGHPEIIQSDGFCQCIEGENPEMFGITAQDYYNSLWSKADKSLAKSVRLVLRKAADPAPGNRFAAIDKFNNFLSKLEHQPGISETSTSKEGHGNEAFPPADSKVEKAGKESATLRSKESVKTKAQPKKLPTPAGRGLDDVAGMAELKALFRRDFIRIVRNPEVAKAYDIKPSNCTLLYGPQGCGKTFIAEKAAQESGLKYKIVSPAELGSIYIHGAQQKIAELFDDAEKNGPMILIFDEFDALVPKRSDDLNVNQANEVNEMLTQLNNCASRGIYVLATTNRPGLLDPAIMRKGRVDRSVYVSLPDADARAELFRLEMGKRPVDGIDYEALARATENYTCSDISFIVAEAARLCFEDTLDSGAAEPCPITMERLMGVIKATVPSVSDAQRKEYLDLKGKMERTQGNERKKVGFAL